MSRRSATLVVLLFFSLILTLEAQTLRTSGFGMGLNQNGQLGTNLGIPLRIKNIGNVTYSVGGIQYSLFLTRNNQVYGIGRNSEGQLCQGSTTSDFFDVILISVSNVVKIAAGDRHSLFSTSTGQLFVCGFGNFGQLGLGDATGRTTPTLNTLVQNVTAIAASSSYSLVLAFNGSLFGFGANGFGQLGLNDTIQRNFPTMNPFLGVNLLDVYCGGESSFVKNATGHYLGFGLNNRFVVSQTTSLNRLFPEYYPFPSNIKELQVGNQFLVFLDTNGDLYAHGVNLAGQLGVGDVNARNFPTKVRIDSVVSYSIADIHVVAITTNNSIYVWGQNDQGQLGISGSQNKVVPAYNPLLHLYQPKRAFAGLTQIVWITKDDTVVSAGADAAVGVSVFVPRYNPVSYGVIKSFYSNAYHKHAAMITFDGSLYMMGDGAAFKIGDGDASNRISPVLINFNKRKVLQAVTGADVSFVLTEGGFVFGWGGGIINGELAQARVFPTLLPALNGTKQISFGNRHGFALSVNGTVLGWGRNNKNELGVTRANSAVPILVPNLPTIVKTFAGEFSSYFLTNTSQLYSTGANNGGQLGLSDKIDRPQATLILNFDNIVDCVAAAIAVACRDISMRVWVFGSSNGRFGMGGSGVEYLVPTLNPFISGVVDIAMADTHVLYLTNTSQAYGAGTAAEGAFGLGNRLTQMFPVLLPIKNVIAISAGQSFSLVINQCNSSLSGPNCDQVLCYGIPSASPFVCSSSGKCVAQDTCECEAPSSGRQCENKEYHWTGLNGAWSRISNWVYKSGNDFVLSLDVPSGVGDIVFFDLPGTYSVVVDVNNLNVNSIFIGSDVAVATININGRSLTTQYLEINKNSRLNVINSVIQVTMANIHSDLVIQGTSVWQSAATNVYAGLLFLGGTFQQTNLHLFAQGAIKPITNSAIRDSNIYINVPVTFETRSITTFDKSNIHVNSNTSFIVESGSSLVASNSMVYNAGSFTIANQTTFVIGIENNGQMLVNGTTTMSSIFKNSPRSSLSLANVNLNFDKPNSTLNVAFGVMFASGLMRGNFNFTSSDDIFRFREPFSLVIEGDANFDESTTMIINIKGSTFAQVDSLNVTGKLTLNSLVLIKMDRNLVPLVNDIYPFLITTQNQLEVPNINLLGVPYKGAVPFLQGEVGYFKITFSIGSAVQIGYDCNYIGNQRILEINRFDKQKKIALSLTTPIRSNAWIGFGFDVLNGSLASSVLAVSYDDQVLEISGHNSTFGTKLLTKESTRSQNIFSIGPSYQTISFILPIGLLDSQTVIFYAELPYLANSSIFNTTGKHYSEIHRFSILKDKVVQECTNFLQALRYEVYAIEAHIIMIVVYAVIFILLLIFYRWRPLVTRGISPFLTIILLMLQLLLEFRNLSEIPYFQGSLCFYYTFGVYPIQQICFIMILLYFVRYFSIINLNENKANLFSSDAQSEKWAKVKIVTLKFLAGFPFALGVLVLSYIFIIFVFFIVLASYGFVCRFETLVVLKSINNIELMVIYFLTLVTLIVDMVNNWSLLRYCKWIDYIFKRDPYWFRAQIILFLPFMIFSLCVEIYLFATSLRYVDIVTHYTTSLILNTIILSVLLILEVLFPLVITIITLIVSLFKKKSTNMKLEDLFKDSELEILFTQHAKSEFSLENVVCYQDMEKFKKGPTLQFAKEIYSKYLNGAQSLLEINCPSSVCIAIKSELDKESITPEMFDKLKSECIKNMNDTFGRFTSSTPYLNYKNTQKLQKELIEGRTVQ